MRRKLDDYVIRLPNYISNEVCDKTLEEVKNFDFKEHNFYNHRLKENKNISGNQELEISFNKVSNQNYIMKRLWHAINTYINEFNFFWHDSWEGYTEPRFNKYSENKKMHEHCDHIHSIFDGKKRGIPTLSILGLLNDDFEGGELVMFTDTNIEFKKGDLILFPSNFLFPHRIEPVKKGTRYSYISWSY